MNGALAAHAGIALGTGASNSGPSLQNMQSAVTDYAHSHSCSFFFFFFPFLSVKTSMMVLVDLSLGGMDGQETLSQVSKS